MRNSHRNSFPAVSREKEIGSISVPFLLLSVVLVSAMLSGITYALAWRSKVALQLRLDTCVEKTALELMKIQNQIESSNLRMKIERAAAIAAALPSGGASLKAAKAVLTAEMIFQEALRMKWKTSEAAWVISRGCDGKSDLLLPLPTLAWWRPPEDSVGPQALEWKGPEKMTIRLWKGNRFAQAAVSKRRRSDGENGNENTHASWNAQYIPPTGIRPNLN